MAAQEPKYRQYKGATAIVVSTIAVAFSLYHILYITGFIVRVGILLDIPRLYRFDLPQHLAIHLGMILALVFLLMPIRGKASQQKLPWYDVVLLVVGVGWNFYMLVNYEPLLKRSTTGYLLTPEVIGSWLNMLIVLEATRRIMGWIVPSIAAVFLIYALFTDYFPGFLRAAPHDWQRVGRYVGLFVTGMYGGILNISATIVVSFMLFSQFLFVTGAGDWFINMAQALLGHVRGGPAKVAVVASSLFGTISGSPVANVMATGVFTIPLMKRIGYKPDFAGAVEAAASTGGQIMPPVMGIAAFMMVDFLGVPYSRIVLAGILPALAYYLAMFLMVDFEAAKTGLRGVPRQELPNLKKTAIAGWQFMLPLAVLVFLLLVLGYSPALSALYATAILVLVGLFTRGNRISVNKIYLALKNTAFSMMMIAVLLALAGIIVGCAELTGLSYRLSMGLVNLAGGNMWVLLLLIAITAIILGMGMTTAAVYLILAAIVAPALVTVGFSPLAAHFFVFYYGVAAFLTPPVCPASYVAAGIAGASPLKTAFTSVRLAIVAFLVPFIFIFQPAFLMEGSTISILLAAIYVILVVFATAGGLTGYMFGPMNYWWRLLFLGGSLLVVYPMGAANAIGSIIIATGILFKLVLSKYRFRSLARESQADSGNRSRDK